MLLFAAAPPSVCASHVTRALALATSMKALQLEKPAGGAQRGQRHVVAVRHVPIPVVGEDMVLVKVRIGTNVDSCRRHEPS